MSGSASTKQCKTYCCLHQYASRTWADPCQFNGIKPKLHIVGRVEMCAIYARVSFDFSLFYVHVGMFALTHYLSYKGSRRNTTF